MRTPGRHTCSSHSFALSWVPAVGHSLAYSLRGESKLGSTSSIVLKRCDSTTMALRRHCDTQCGAAARCGSTVRQHGAKVLGDSAVKQRCAVVRERSATARCDSTVRDNTVRDSTMQLNQRPEPKTQT